MKLMLIECNAEELRANRTVLDSVADAIGSFAQAFAGVSIKPEAVAEAMSNYCAEEIAQEAADVE